MKKTIEIHVLQNFAPSNLNRDDTGAPKDALFGGTCRARISSQCFKRAVRQYFVSMVQQGVMEDCDVAVRTKRVLEPLTAELVKLGRSEAEAQAKVQLALSSIQLKTGEDGKNEYLLFLGKREIQEISRVINEKWDVIDVTNAPVSEKKVRNEKKAAAKHADPEVKKALESVFCGGKAIDVALFGRMLTDMPSKNQYAACQVAHSISTHAVKKEFDFYTAIDDLKPDDMAGSDMLGTVEFNSACFYRYSNIDLNKLLENLQGDKTLAQRSLRLFLEAFIMAVPTGKQNTFAAHNLPEYVAITVRQNGGPRNLANAFETAIYTRPGESITHKSAEQLAKKAKSLQEAFGGKEKTVVLNLLEFKNLGFGTEVTSMQELLDNIMTSVED